MKALVSNRRRLEMISPLTPAPRILRGPRAFQAVMPFTKSLKAQNLAKRQRAHAESVSTFQVSSSGTGSFTSKNDRNNAYTINLQAETNHDLGSQTNLFEQFTTNTPSLPSTSHTPQPQVNPYTQDASSLGVAAFYSGSGNYPVPVSI